MSDPLDDLAREIRERSDAIPHKVEEALGIPFDQVKHIAAHIFDGMPSDPIIRTVRQHLLDTGFSMEQLNASLDEMVTGARQHVKFIESGERSVEELRASMLYLNYMYLGFLVTEYAEFLFAKEE